MALMYKLYKMQRTFKDGRTDTANGKWYARAVKLGTYDTADLAEIIQRNSLPAILAPPGGRCGNRQW